MVFGNVHEDELLFSLIAQRFWFWATCDSNFILRSVVNLIFFCFVLLLSRSGTADGERGMTALLNWRRWRTRIKMSMIILTHMSHCSLKKLRPIFVKKTTAKKVLRSSHLVFFGVFDMFLLWDLMVCHIGSWRVWEVFFEFKHESLILS